MCTALEQLQAGALALASGFRPELLAKHDLERTIEAAGRIAKAMSVVANLATTALLELDQTGRGERQARQLLASAAGVGHGRAKSRIEAARKLASCPEVEAAARDGQLSDDQLIVVTDALEHNPSAAGRLLHKATTSSLKELAEESARVRAEGRDIEDQRRAAHAGRFLRSWTNPDGTWHMHARGRLEDGAKIMAAVAAGADTAFRDSRAAGRRESPEAYAFDGLVALTLGTQPGHGRRADLLVRVDLPALLRGYPIEGELCEIAGYGPISTQAVMDMIDSGDPFLKVIVTKAKDVAGVVHMGRRPHAYQSSALDWIYPTCAAEGCAARAQHLQSDHRHDWSRTHVTVLHLLDRLCKFHHDLKTYEGWRLVPGKGKRPFVAPNDSRHPGSPTSYPRRTISVPKPAPPLPAPRTSGPPGRAADQNGNLVGHPGPPTPRDRSTPPAPPPKTTQSPPFDHPRPKGEQPCLPPYTNEPSPAPSTSSSRTSTSTAGRPQGAIPIKS